jgi:hypothetical protein
MEGDMKNIIAVFIGLFLLSCNALPIKNSIETIPTKIMMPTQTRSFPSNTPTRKNPPTPTRIPPTNTFPPTNTPVLFPTLGRVKDISTSNPFFLSLYKDNSKWSILYFPTNASGVAVVDLPLDLTSPDGSDLFHFELSRDGKWLLLYNEGTGNTRYSGYLYNIKTGIFTLLPKFQHFRLHNIQFSGDSKYLAYISGSYMKDCIYGTPVGCEESLIVIRLSDLKNVVEINLLPKNYPDNLSELNEIWKKQNLPYDDPSLYSFFGGLGFLQWSPNGKNLAFSGATYGPSTDIYLFRVDEQKIRQITNGPGNIFYLFWDPSGSYIFNYSTTKSGCGGAPCEGSQFFLSSIMDGSTKELINFMNCLAGAGNKKLLWPSITNMVFTDYYQIIKYNILSQNAETIIPGGVKDASGDKSSNTILILTDANEYLLYTAAANTIKKLDIQGNCSLEENRILGDITYRNYRYLLFCENSSYFVSPDAQILEMPYSSTMAGASQTGKWLILYAEKGTLLLFDSTRKLINQVEINLYPSDLTLREPFIFSPKDDGVFIIGDFQTYYFTIPNLDMKFSAYNDISIIPIGWVK